MKMIHLIGLVLMVAVSSLAGCHGGGGSEPTTVVSGVASKGPIKGGTIKVFAIRGGIEDRSTPLGQGPTTDNGNYTIDIGAYTGPILVEATGGSFTDEVSGAAVTMKAPLRAVFSNASAGTQAMAITPLTELAYKKAVGAGALLTNTSIDDANANVSSYFKLTDIISTLPQAGGGSDDQKKYAAVLASFAQYVSNNKNKTESLDDALSRLITQIGDEVKNLGGFSISTINGINTAISDFEKSGKNKTGAAATPLAAPASGLLKLSTAGTATISAIDVTVNFPAGVTVLDDAITGEAAAGVVTISGPATADKNVLSSAKFTPASGGTPAQLHIAFASVTGFGTGEFATIKFDLDAGVSFPAGASAFSISGFSAVEADGSQLSGITASPVSVAAEMK
jgi:hypothetical protein